MCLASSRSRWGCRTGPYRDRPAFDLAIQAISGAMSITGEPGRPLVRMGVTMGDLGGSLFCTLAISAALYAREKTGLGRKIDTPSWTA